MFRRTVVFLGPCELEEGEVAAAAAVAGSMSNRKAFSDSHSSVDGKFPVTFAPNTHQDTRNEHAQQGKGGRRGRQRRGGRLRSESSEGGKEKTHMGQIDHLQIDHDLQ